VEKSFGDFVLLLSKFVGKSLFSPSQKQTIQENLSASHSKLNEDSLVHFLQICILPQATMKKMW
jgi:hypothetical protein